MHLKEDEGSIKYDRGESANYRLSNSIVVFGDFSENIVGFGTNSTASLAQLRNFSVQLWGITIWVSV